MELYEYIILWDNDFFHSAQGLRDLSSDEHVKLHSVLMHNSIVKKLVVKYT